MTQAKRFVKPLFTAGVQLTRLGSYLGHDYTRLSAAQFRLSSPAAGLIGWNEKPHLLLADIAKDRKHVGRIALELFKQSGGLTGTGQTHFQLMDDKTLAHAYLTRTVAYPLSKVVLRWFLDAGNHNPFRTMVSCFPPSGIELPGDQPPAVMVPDLGGDFVVENQLELEAWPRLIATHAKRLFDGNEPIGGLVALGRSGLVTFSDYHVVEVVEEEFDLLIRYALASTNPYHVFDGRVIWIQVIDRRTGRVMFFGLGGGTHPFTLIDGANPAAGGIVFPTMLRTQVELLNLVKQDKEITDGSVLGVGTGFDSVPADLLRVRRMMWWFDQVGRAGAALRTVLGPDVVGAPAVDPDGAA